MWHVRNLTGLLVALAIVLLEPFPEHALRSLAASKAPLDCSCIGPEEASLNIVYLHGRDTFGPSWTEIRNRQKLRAIARLLNARIALPRTRSSWLSHGRVDGTISSIESAAQTCFRPRAPFALLGFSDGANAATRLFLDCRSDVTKETIVVGASEGDLNARTDLSRCGEITLIAGRHEAGLATSTLFARQLQKRHARVQFVAHAGPHELPFAETVSVLRRVAR